MKLKKILAIAMSAVVFATSMVACTPADTAATATPGTQAPSTEMTATETTGGKILNLNNISEPGSLHPGLAQGTHESWAINHMFEGLFRKAQDGKIENGVADMVTISEDGLTYTITLKEGTLWSNGDPVIAADFVEEWFWVLDPANASKYSGQLLIFKGAKEFNEGTGARDTVAIKAIDDKTIEFTLNSPIAYLQDYMTHFTFLPVNSKVAAANPDWHLTGETYVSNGPFILTSWNHKESLDFKKNGNYFEADKIKLDGVHMIMLEDQITAWQNYQAGSLDMGIDLPVDVVGKLNAENFAELKIEPDLATYYYEFNTKVKPFNNVKVRKALAMSIDRNAITNTILQGGQQSAYGFTPPGVPDTTGDYQKNLGPLFQENNGEAKKLLEEGLAEEGMPIQDFKFTLIYNTSDSHKRIAEAAQGMWKANLGIDITIENMEFQVVLDRRTAGDFDVVRAAWIGDYVDPMTFLGLFISEGEFNDGKWVNAEYDELIKKAKIEQEPDTRFEMLKQAEKILMEEMPIMPIYFYTKPYTVKPYVTGIWKPVNKQPDFRYADIQPH